MDQVNEPIAKKISLAKCCSLNFFYIKSKIGNRFRQSNIV